jgi:hypothetical protein
MFIVLVKRQIMSNCSGVSATLFILAWNSYGGGGMLSYDQFLWKGRGFEFKVSHSGNGNSAEVKSNWAFSCFSKEHKWMGKNFILRNMYMFICPYLVSVGINLIIVHVHCMVFIIHIEGCIVTAKVAVSHVQLFLEEWARSRYSLFRVF